MPHYDFDIRDGRALSVDEEGLTLANQRAAEIEAALSLADTAKDLAPSASGRRLAIAAQTIAITNA